MTEPFAVDRARHYLSLGGAGVQIKDVLGGGIDGDVWSTTNKTAIKVFKTLQGYGNEWGSYDRLATVGVTNEIDGFWVPRMLGWNESLMVIEMDIIQHPPYILDFGKVRFSDPEFSAEIQRDLDVQGREMFEHNWLAVKSLLATLESFGIYYLDPRPGNIVFPDHS